jgi:predicted house-cleaning NTP pyrophosphatase (Maf/HAM1 superfamily)
MKRIILASTSPRRRALLEQIGLKFTVDARVREDTEFVGQEPHQLAREIALKKAKSVSHQKRAKRHFEMKNKKSEAEQASSSEQS